MENAIQLITAFLGSLGFAMLFHVRREKLLLASLGGLLIRFALALKGKSNKTKPQQRKGPHHEQTDLRTD